MELLQFAEMINTPSSLLALVDDVSLPSHIILDCEAKVLVAVSPANFSIFDDHRRVSSFHSSEVSYHFLCINHIQTEFIMITLSYEVGSSLEVAIFETFV